MTGLWNKFYLRMNSDPNQGGGGGAAGSANLLGGAGGGSGAPPAAGSGNPGGASNSGNSSSADSGNPGGSPAPASTDWRSSLPKELQDHAQLKRYQDPTALASAYVNLQRQFSSDKIAIPGQNSTDEDWTQVYRKLGVPEDAAKYEIKFKEQAGIAPEFANEFKATGHKLGILPKQAQALADWFADRNMTFAQTMKQEQDTKAANELKGLQDEWGQAYAQKLSRAQAVLDKFADKDLGDYLTQSGLVNDTKLVRFLAKVGETYLNEDTVIGDGSPSGKALAPNEAKAAADKIMGDKTHPYHLKDHPSHKAAVEEVSKLFNLMHQNS